MQKTIPSAIALSFLGALALFHLPGCDIAITDQEVQVKINDADNSLEALVIYRGITATKESPEDVDKAVAIVERILSGRREFAIGEWWPGHVDLDDPAICQGLDGEDLLVIQSISLREVGGFLDDRGRLSGYQVLRIDGLTRALSSLNRAISRAIFEDPNFAQSKEDDVLGDRTRQLWIERAMSGEPWIRRSGSVIEIDLPMTRETSEKLRRLVIEQVTRPDEHNDWTSLAAFLLQMKIDIGDERLLLTFAGPDAGAFHFASHDPKANYSPKLLKALAARDIHPEDGPSLEEVRAKLSPDGAGR